MLRFRCLTKGKGAMCGSAQNTQFLKPEGGTVTFSLPYQGKRSHVWPRTERTVFEAGGKKCYVFIALPKEKEPPRPQDRPRSYFFRCAPAQIRISSLTLFFSLANPPESGFLCSTHASSGQLLPVSCEKSLEFQRVVGCDVTRCFSRILPGQHLHKSWTCFAHVR